MAHVNSVLLIAGWLAIVFVMALFCKKKFPNKQELTRKIIHIGTGPIIPLAWWLNISREFAIGIASIITIVLFINHQIRLFGAIEDIQRKSYGTTAYGLSITLLLICFWPKHASAVTAGILVMAFGDGFAGLIGREVKSKKWHILGQQKSFAGTLTMFLVGGSVLIVISLITSQPFEPLNLFIISCLAVLLEQISWWGIDNLTVPIGVALSWRWLLGV